MNKLTSHLNARRMILFIAVAGIYIGTLCIGGTYAWFTDTETQVLNLSAGKVNYEFVIPTGIDVDAQTTGIQLSPMLPGKNIIESPISLKNLSTVNSHLRLKIEYTVWKDASGTPSESTVLYTGGALSLDNPLDTSIIKYVAAPKSGGFEYVAVDTADLKSGYFYYKPAKDATDEYMVAPTADAVNGTAVDIFNNVAGTNPFVFKYDGASTGNLYAGRGLKVTFTFEAKQAEYVKWTNIGTITAYVGN